MKKRPTERRDEAPVVQGEGNVEAARRFNQAERSFVEAGKVPDAARQAKPHDAAQAKDLEHAEDIGRSHAKDEDPAIRRPEQRAK